MEADGSLVQVVSRLLREYGWPDSFRRTEHLEAVQREREAAMDTSTNS